MRSGRAGRSDRSRDSAPPARPSNPPGQRFLRYRAGTFDSFQRQMFDQLVLALQSGAAEGSGSAQGAGEERPVRINLDGADHWLGAVVKSWAAVADVLTFYQERILHEGYLNTAVEDRSVHELAQMIGYRRRPGVAGSADLAVRISEVQGLPQELRLPQRLVVRSVPPPGSEPLVFETVEPLAALAAWNLLRPAAKPRAEPPTLPADCRALELLGTATGLTPGAGILIAGDLDGRRRRWFRTAGAVKPQAGDPPVTRVEWAEPLAAPRDGAAITDPEVFALRQQTALFGHNAPRWQDLPPEVRNRLQILRGGVMAPGEAGWQSLNQGLPLTASIQCLAVDDGGNLYAGTGGDAVFRSLDGGKSWTPARRGLLQPDVQALAVGAEGTLFAGTSGGGVYRSTDQGEIWEPANGSVQIQSRRWRWLPRFGRPAGPLPMTTVRALAVFPYRGRSILLAATDSGIYRSHDSGRSWRPANRGLPGVDRASGAADVVVRALAPTATSGLVFAGTARGVFKSTNGGRRWRAVNRGLPATDPFSGVSATEVVALVAYRDRRRNVLVLIAATARGLFRSSDGGKHWQRSESGLDGPGGPAGLPPKITTLVVLDDPIIRVVRIYAGAAGGLWSSLDHGESWTRVDLGEPLGVRAMAVGRDGRTLVLATPFSGFAGEWPAFRLRDGRIDLDSVVPGIVAGSWIALRPGSAADPDAAGVFQVRRASTVQRRDFSLVATVTRLEVEDPEGRLPAFDLREARAYVLSDELTPRPRLVTETLVSLSLLRGTLLSMGDGTRRVIVTGKTLPRRFAREAAGDALPGTIQALQAEVAGVAGDAEVSVRVWTDASQGARPDLMKTMRAADLAELLRAIVKAPGSAQSLQRVFGVGAALAAAAGAADDGGTERLRIVIDVLPATIGCALPAGELAAYLESSTSRTVPGPDFGSTVDVEVVAIRPQPGSEPMQLDLATLQVFGNVVRAREGVTMVDEVLGDGDATEENQSFRLAHPPAFFRGSAFPRPSLAVAVQHQAWEEVPLLLRTSGESRVYRLQLDENGRGTVIFGDGEAGARLPSGSGNVVATYSTGMTDRQVPPEGLSLLATRPLGLEAVRNPLPSTPGAPAEGSEELRRAAPRQVRLLDRIVALRDYEDYAVEFPGIEKAGTWGLIVAGAPAVQITVAAPGGIPLGIESELLGQLRAGIEPLRAHPAPVYIQSYRPVEVAIAAKVRLVPGHEWAEVERRIRAVLAGRFGFDASAFAGSGAGAGISAAAVVSAIQSVRGVRAVDLDSFTWAGMAAAGEAGRHECRAKAPYWDAAALQLIPAELVRLGQIELTLDGAP